MATRVIGLLLARDKDALLELASNGRWEILPGTGYAFDKLTSDDDLSLHFVDGMDGIMIDGPGCTALAFRDE